jgi:putative transposase
LERLIGKLTVQNEFLKKAIREPDPPVSKKKELVEKHKSGHPATWLLDAIGLGRKSWYQEQKEPEADLFLKEEIEFILNDDLPFYGYRKVTKELKRQGWKVNHKRIRRIMKSTVY